MSRDKTNREEKMSEIQQKLEIGIREIFESNKYEEYITTMAKFPSYSINNCILIASQCPSATFVCGYRKWQNEFNRVVNRSEHGIMIIAPVKYKADVEELVFDKNNHPVLDGLGNQVKEKVKKEVQAFRPAYVFDVQQTTGDPLPSLVNLLKQGVEGYEQIKNALITISSATVSFEQIEGGANGYFVPSEQRIVVKSDMSELQTIKTLIHEIAHAELGHGGKDDKWDRESKEVMAESVAYWVSQLLELDTSEYSFGYISGWSKSREVTELKENLDLIKATADKISSDLEQELIKDRVEQPKLNTEQEQNESSSIQKKKSR